MVKDNFVLFLISKLSLTVVDRCIFVAVLHAEYSHVSHGVPV